MECRSLFGLTSEHRGTTGTARISVSEAAAWIVLVFVVAAFLAGVLYGFCDENVPQGSVDESICEFKDGPGMELVLSVPPLLMLLLTLTVRRRTYVRLSGVAVVGFLALLLLLLGALN